MCDYQSDCTALSYGEEDSKRYRAMQVVSTMSGNLTKTQTLTKLVKNGSTLIAPDEAKILELMSK